MTVPFDYSQPDGAQIDIAVARSVSTGEDVLGSLILNPGGPGASGIEFLTQSAAIFPTELAERFDLVSFDPRGVGSSTAFDCQIAGDDKVEVVPPNDPEAYAELVAETEKDIESCPTEAIELAPHLGTVNAARDLDQLRSALGDEKLSYVGFSYGTRLGSVYADMFPDNVRALVLDGAVKPSTDQYTMALEQTAGFESALASFTEACDADPDCYLSDYGETTLDVITDLQAEIREAGSIPAGDDRKLTLGEFNLAIAAALYSKEAWPALASGLELAEVNQDGSVLQILADSYVGRRDDGTYNNSSEAIGAITCADTEERLDIAELERQANKLAKLSGILNETFRANTGCYGMPKTMAPIELGPAPGTPPILVIGTTGDPATPYEWSVELADFLESGVLYSVEGEGHTAFLTFECVTPVVVDYLLESTVPESGDSCQGAVAGEEDFFPAAEPTEEGEGATG